jgi:hypothetical protein
MKQKMIVGGMLVMALCMGMSNMAKADPGCYRGHRGVAFSINVGGGYGNAGFYSAPAPVYQEPCNNGGAYSGNTYYGGYPERYVRNERNCNNGYRREYNNGGNCESRYQGGYNNRGNCNNGGYAQERRYEGYNNGYERSCR